MTQRWNDLTSTQKTAILVLSSVQLSMAVTAWTDLALRDPDRVEGSKATWAVLIAVNFVGPVLYFARGRKPRP